jgi:hypothetical protein
MRRSPWTYRPHRYVRLILLAEPANPLRTTSSDRVQNRCPNLSAGLQMDAMRVELGRLGYVDWREKNRPLTAWGFIRTGIVLRDDEEHIGISPNWSEPLMRH